MKIAIFSDNFYPELSGISDSIIILAKELAKLGHHVNFYVPKYSLKNYQKISLAQKEINLGPLIKINRLFSLPFPTTNSQGRFVFPTSLYSLKVKKFNPDIIHSQLFFGVGLEALAAAKLLNKPIVGTNHTAITEFIRSSPKWLKKFSLRYLVWYYNHCDYVTAPSQSVIAEMKNFGFKKPHQVISNPIDLVTFKSSEKFDKKKFRQKFNLTDSMVIYAGRLSKEKNIEVIIQAMALVKKKIPDINLALAGHGKAELELKKLDRQLSLEDNIKFLGTVDQPTLSKLYRAAKIFVITSTSETQSLVMLQAMACGLPIIAAKSRALPEYVSDKNGLLIEIGDYEDLAKKIIYLLENHEIRKKLGQGALSYVQQFSAPNIAKQWEKLYQRVIIDFNKKGG